MSESFVSLKNLTLAYGDTVAVSKLSLNIRKGELITLLGPSGCGKTTTMRAIAGLLSPRSGTIEIDGNDVTKVPANKRGVGLVFQSYALFPHLSAFENVAFGLRLRKVSNGEIKKRVEQSLDTVELGEFANRKPSELSGGQQQRLSLARSLVLEPKVMLLDEPFASVDTPLRRQLRQDSRHELKQAGSTTIMVTHDPEEAMAMADRILVLVDGKAVQLDAPEMLWRQPAHRFVAETIAGLQTLRGTVSADCITTAFGRLPIRNVRGASALTDGASVILGVRGSTVSITDETTDESAQAAVEDIRFDGMHWTALIQHQDQQLRFVLDHKSQVQTGSRVALRFTDAEAILYS